MNRNLIVQVKKNFIKKFHKDPLLVFSPGRINLIGEHTDYNDGFVFPAAINKGIYIALSKSDESFSTVIALDKKEAYQFDLDTIQPLQYNSWKNYILGVVAELQKTGKKIHNFNLVFSGDIPGGAGLSSSASLENGIAFGLNKLFDLNLSKNELVFISQRAEHNFTGVQCGIMDQYASMFGQENSAMLLDCRNLETTMHSIDFSPYEIILINSNITHQLAESEYNKRREVCEKVASILKIKALRDATTGMLKTIQSQLSKDEFEKAIYVIEENKRVLTATKTLESKNYQAFGNLLLESHEGLSNQYKVSCRELDFLVGMAKKNQYVLGARMMGGGFGGCTINLVRKDETDNFINEVRDSYISNFDVQVSAYQVKLGKGTQLITI